jgi:hypothetical protein
MQRRSVVAVVLGVVSVACATGVLEHDRSSAVVEPLAPQGAVPVAAGQVTGIVRHHTSGSAIAGALIIVQCACLQGARETTTDKDGVYSLRDLPPGKYTVQVLFKDANVNKTFEMPPGVGFRVNFRIDPDLKFNVVIGALSRDVSPLARLASTPT